MDSLAVTNVNDMVEYIYSLSSMALLWNVPKQYIKNILMRQTSNGVLHVPKEYGMFRAAKKTLKDNVIFPISKSIHYDHYISLSSLVSWLLHKFHIFTYIILESSSRMVIQDCLLFRFSSGVDVKSCFWTIRGGLRMI